jgi:hypothetical protein
MAWDGRAACAEESLSLIGPALVSWALRSSAGDDWGDRCLTTYGLTHPCGRDVYWPLTFV